MAELYCPNCAAPVAPAPSSCSHCGAEFGPGAAWAPTPVRRPSPEGGSGPSSKRHSGSKWLWLLAGAAYGVLLRMLFGQLPDRFGGPMSFAFLIGTPLAVGAISVYAARPASLLRAFILPFLPMTMMLLGTAVTLLEGSICIAIMAPLFFALAGVGGVCMTLALRIAQYRKRTLASFAALPFILIPLDQQAPVDTFHEIQESIHVAAPADAVWASIVSARDIRPDELPSSLVHLIGVPKPIHAENRLTPTGEMRFSQWEKGVHFTADVVQRTDQRSITWRYSFQQDSFPPGSMDDHVVLGGRYIDLGDTTFNIVPRASGCELQVIGRYRLATPVNLYAVPLSRLLGHDFLRTLLGFYKRRAEHAAGV